MKRFLQKLIFSGTLLVAGAIFGPVVLAVTGGAIATWQSEDPFNASNEASLLVTAYQQQLSPGRLFLSIDLPEDGGECGYDPVALFPDAHDELVQSVEGHRFSEYVGYYALDRWRNQSRDEEYISAIAARIDESVDQFEIGFLRRCITSTVFSSICMDRVSGFDSGVPRFDHSRTPRPAIGWGIEDEIVCTYVDGVAARRAIPLTTSE